MEPDRIYTFGKFRLGTRPVVLMLGDEQVKLRMQALRLLMLLVERAESLVTHEDIRRVVWNGRTVDLNTSLPVCIGQIRAALGDSAESPSYIETVPRQGYRFLLPVSTEDRPATHAAPMRGRPYILPIAAGTVFVALLAAAGVWLADDQGASTSSSPAAVSDPYLRGKYLLDQGTPANANRSVEFFLQALAADPEHAPSHIGLAAAYRLGGEPERAKQHAHKALALEPQSADAHLQVATSAMHEWNWVVAGRHLDRALTLDPRSAETHNVVATRHVILGNIAAAIKSMRVAIAIDPASALLRADIGWFHLFAGENGEAIARCREALDLSPNHYPSLLCIERAAGAQGDFETARDAALRLMRAWRANESAMLQVTALPPDRAVAKYRAWRLEFYLTYPHTGAITAVELAEASAAAGDFDRAMAALEKAADQREPLLPFVLADPIFGPLRAGSRFNALRSRMTLPPFVSPS